MLAFGLLAATVALAGILYANITVFVLQPIGAVPEGATFLIPRESGLRFVDSADALCERRMGGVSLLCRMSMITNTVDPDNIYMRLPYQEWLYSYSTGGKKYER